MERRCAGVFVTLILLFMAMVLRIFVLSRSAYYAAVAGGQSSWLLGVDQSRGQIYDCNLKPLTGSETRYVAAVEPSAEAAGALYPVLAEEDREAAEITQEQFMERMELDAIQIYEDGAFEFWFNDGDLFWGHSIHVTGSLTNGPEEAQMEG